MRIIATLLLFLMSTSLWAQQALMVVDSGLDRVLLLSKVDGSVINSSFIVDASQQTCINAVQVPSGNIYISDQLAGAVYEYTLGGAFVGTVVGAPQGLANIRGIAVNNNQLYVTVASGTFANTVQRFNLNGTGQSTFITSTNLISPFDVFFRANGEVLVSNGTTTGTNNSLVQRFDSSGNFLGTFQTVPPPTGAIRFPQQIFERSNGNVLVGGFSVPSALYEYDAAGNQVNALAPGLGVRGVYELDNGNYLFTAGTRLATVNPTSGLVTDIINNLGPPASSFRFIEPIVLAVPEPETYLLCTVVALGAGGYWYRRRRTRLALLEADCS